MRWRRSRSANLTSIALRKMNGRNATRPATSHCSFQSNHEEANDVPKSVSSLVGWIG
ncbi:MAG: hypothetical protein KIS78_22860 [Labilithrix sp.]|nr:hypothetical protein [Labilithrix sp.]